MGTEPRRLGIAQQRCGDQLQDTKKAAWLARYEESLESWRQEPCPKRENQGHIKVFLNVYTMPGITGRMSGVYHSGVEICFQEYYFAARQDLKTGVCRCSPRTAPGWKFKERIDLGGANLTLKGVDLHAALYKLKSEWRGKDYDLSKRNCNHFSNALCQILLQKALRPQREGTYQG